MIWSIPPEIFPETEKVVRKFAWRPTTISAYLNLTDNTVSDKNYKIWLGFYYLVKQYTKERPYDIDRKWLDTSIRFLFYSKDYYKKNKLTKVLRG